MNLWQRELPTRGLNPLVLLTWPGDLAASHGLKLLRFFLKFYFLGVLSQNRIFYNFRHFLSNIGKLPSCLGIGPKFPVPSQRKSRKSLIF